jgi:hypothetical protein
MLLPQQQATAPHSEENAEAAGTTTMEETN